MGKKSKNNTNSKPVLDMRSHILTVASTLISELGIKETSLKKISEVAAISKGTLYYYYSAKEDIIYDIADQNLTQITDEMIAWVNEVDTNILPEAILKTLFENILEAETRAKLHLYLLNDAITANSSLADKFEKRYNEWRETLIFGIDKVLPKKSGDNVALSYLILALLDGLIIQKMFGTKDIPLDDIIKIIIGGNQDHLDK